MRCSKTEKMIRNSLISDIVYVSLGVNSDQHPTSANKPEASGGAPINTEGDESPAKKQKLNNKEFEGEE